MNKVSKIGKPEVYNWHLSPELKALLEAAAKDDKTTIDTILERLVCEWLKARALAEENDEARQRALHALARLAMGTVSVGGPSATNAEVRKVMGEFLEAKHRASQRRAPRRAG
jgi:hypothetical protein